MRQFYTIDTYERTKARYHLLPFRFLRLDSQRELVVTDVGEYLIVPTGTVNGVVTGKTDPQSSLYKTLKAKQFIYDDDSTPMLDVLRPSIERRRAFWTASPNSISSW
jgi:hypothetical protein